MISRIRQLSTAKYPSSGDPIIDHQSTSTITDALNRDQPDGESNISNGRLSPCKINNTTPEPHHPCSSNLPVTKDRLSPPHERLPPRSVSPSPSCSSYQSSRCTIATINRKSSDQTIMTSRSGRLSPYPLYKQNCDPQNGRLSPCQFGGSIYEQANQESTPESSPPLARLRARSPVPYACCEGIPSGGSQSRRIQTTPSSRKTSAEVPHYGNRSPYGDNNGRLSPSSCCHQSAMSSHSFDTSSGRLSPGWHMSQNGSQSQMSMSRDSVESTSRPVSPSPNVSRSTSPVQFSGSGLYTRASWLSCSLAESTFTSMESTISEHDTSNTASASERQNTVTKTKRRLLSGLNWPTVKHSLKRIRASSSLARGNSVDVEHVVRPSTGRTSSQRPYRRNRQLQRSTAVVGYDVLYSPQLYRPMRYITRVESVSEDGYVRLNQYKIQQEIGMGSYGIVKLAYNEQDNNLYAMKVLDKIKLTKKFACFRKPPPRRNKTSNTTSVAPDPLHQVQREIAILRKLNHPNVVKLVEVLDDESDRFLYMVFEYLERSAVMEIPTTEVLSEATAWRYFRDTILGLEYLHHQKIIHRDIKPSNLLLTDDEHVKIADFGVSSEFEGIDAFLTGTAGTPAFMAPESLTEDSVAFYSGRAQDIWSTGITLYAFVFGQVPWHDNYVIALYKKIKHDPLIFPDKPIISDSLKNLMRGMLVKDPGLRMTLPEVKDHPWVTRTGTQPLPSEDENCHLITVTDEEVRNCVRVVPKLDTLILIKAMGRHRSFGNPFRRRSSGAGRRRAFSRSPDPGLRRLEVLTIDDLESKDKLDTGNDANAHVNQNMTGS